MKNMKVVYFHRRKDTNEVFYVGIGNKNRPYEYKNRNKFWKRVAKKYGYIVEVVHNNLYWKDACKLEIKYIKKFGRADLGLGTLTNLTDGGEARIGYIYTDEHKKRIGDANRGTKWSDEAKQKLSKSLTGRELSQEHIDKIRAHAETLKGTTRPSYIGKKISKARMGHEVSLQTRKKLSIANTGKKHTDEAREKIIQGLIGRPVSEETRKKISESHMGKIVSEETRKKLSEINSGENHRNWGKSLSEETRKKISESHMGKVVSEETRKKLSIANTGKKHTEESRKKIIESLIGRPVSEETRKKIGDANRGRKLPPISEQTRQKLSKAKRGEGGTNKLTENNVRSIRRMYSEGTHTHQSLADKFGVKKACITHILNRRTWKHI